MDYNSVHDHKNQSHTDPSQTLSYGSNGDVNHYDYHTLPYHTASTTITTTTTATRFWILTVFSVLSWVQGVQWNTWGPISESMGAAFPGWGSSTVAMMANWGTIMFVVFVFPMCWATQRYGLRKVVLASTALIFLGTAIRCVTTAGPVFTILSSSRFLFDNVTFLFPPCEPTIGHRLFLFPEKNIAKGRYTFQLWKEKKSEECRQFREDWGDDAMWVGQISVVLSSLSPVASGRFNDLVKGHVRSTLILLMLATTICCYWFLLLSYGVLAPSKWQVYVSVVGGTAFNYATYPLLYEVGVDLAYPAPEILVSGALTAALEPNVYTLPSGLLPPDAGKNFLSLLVLLFLVKTGVLLVDDEVDDEDNDEVDDIDENDDDDDGNDDDVYGNDDVCDDNDDNVVDNNENVDNNDENDDRGDF
nr:LOW QUALITY PROTEIN: uncharacterized protein LOC128702397 [Cherax quadricarinatus]